VVMAGMLVWLTGGPFGLGRLGGVALIEATLTVAAGLLVLPWGAALLQRSRILRKELLSVLGRMKVMLAVILTVLTLFTIRLMYLQLVMGEEYVAKSQQNALQQRRIIPLRGRILARDGTVLADDRVAYDLLYRGGEISDWQALAALLGIEGPPKQP